MDRGGEFAEGKFRSGEGRLQDEFLRRGWPPVSSSGGFDEAC
jgi:hypothetical protein